MKKIISLIAISTLLISCTTDVKFNNPGFQAYRDGTLFSGIDMKAYQDTSGHITLTAIGENETVDLEISSSNIGTYYFGTSNTSNVASYNTLLNGYDLTYQTDVISGPVSKIETPLIAGGTGYTPANLIPTSGGSGNGLTVKIQTSAGIVTSVTVSSPGNGYKAGDLITISSGNLDAKFRVLNVEGSNGELIITDNTGGTLTGTFKFNAPKIGTSTVGNSFVNFNNGAFYKIPILPAL